MDFEPVNLTQKERIDALTSRYGEGSCQHSFVSMYALREKYGDGVCLDGGCLFVRRENLCGDGLSVYLAPMGAGSFSESVERLLEDARQRGTRLRFFTLTEKNARALAKAFPGRFRYERERDYAEYFFRRDRLAEMSGPALSKKRSNLRRFYKNCPGEPEARPLTPALVPEILTYLEDWIALNAEDHDRSAMLRERASITAQLSNFETFRLRGTAVYIGGSLRGFVYGTPLSDQVFDGLVMKGDRNVTQMGVYLYQQAALCCGRPFLNAEEDLGFPGLRESKLSYRPEFLLEKFVVTEV